MNLDNNFYPQIEIRILCIIELMIMRKRYYYFLGLIQTYFIEALAWSVTENVTRKSFVVSSLFLCMSEISDLDPTSVRSGKELCGGPLCLPSQKIVRSAVRNKTLLGEIKALGTKCMFVDDVPAN